MKIGIMTFHWAQNYGAVLQCYALKCKLEELGHDVWIIDRLPRYNGVLRRLYHRFSFKYYLSWMKFAHF
ncbi:MAG: polysaccharide pyruvyl transferase family protein, partial [Bacteroidaceae bacterium]|nr:polysaccharide pyruvyl transferase family protein [Bacteroidaceae bacterium]